MVAVQVSCKYVGTNQANVRLRVVDAKVRLDCGYFLPSGKELEDAIHQHLAERGWEVEAVEIEEIYFPPKRIRWR